LLDKNPITESESAKNLRECGFVLKKLFLKQVCTDNGDNPTADAHDTNLINNDNNNSNKSDNNNRGVCHSKQ
jgi:hypothetical protein